MYVGVPPFRLRESGDADPSSRSHRVKPMLLDAGEKKGWLMDEPESWKILLARDGGVVGWSLLGGVGGPS